MLYEVITRESIAADAAVFLCSRKSVEAASSADRQEPVITSYSIHYTKLYEMTLTAPACPVAGTLPNEVGRVSDAVPGVTDATVRLVWSPAWTQERMSDEAMLQLGLF